MSKEAMKLALEVLEYPGPSWLEARQPAITALRQALEQPEPEPVAWAISYDGETPYALWDGGDCALLDIEVKRHGGKTRKMPLYTSPPKREPESEPVIDKSAAIRIATSLGWTPQRKPLTDEELKDALVSVDPETKRLPPGFRDFARAIEAAHGIKENT